MAPKGTLLKRPAAAASSGGPMVEEPESDTEVQPKKVASTGQGDIYSSRMASSAKLSEKLADFQRVVKEKNLQDQPQRDLLKQFFTPAEMSALWNKLAANSKKQTFTVKEAWESLNSMSSGQKEAKLQVLLDFIRKPSDTWAQKLLRRVDEIKHQDSTIEEKEEFTYGQLEKMHGEFEAAELVSRGKYEKVEDSDGDVMYIKKRKVHRVAVSKESRMQYERTQRSNDDEWDNMEDMFASWMGGLKKGENKLFPGPMKKPAASNPIDTEEKSDGQEQGQKKHLNPKQDHQKKLLKSIAQLSSLSQVPNTTKHQVKKNEMSKPLVLRLTNTMKEVESKRKEASALSTSKAAEPEKKKFTSSLLKLFAESKDLKQKSKAFMK